MNTNIKVTNYYPSAIKETNNIIKQKRLAEKYLNEYGYSSVSIEDSGFSGLTHPLNRPSFCDLSLLIEKGVIQKVVIDTTARLSRSNSHLYDIRLWLEEHGVELVILDCLKGEISYE